MSDELKKFLEQDFENRKDRVGYLSFNWFRGVDAIGLTVTFRFPRGGDPKMFEAHVIPSKITDVQGPFKTRKAAHVG